MWVQWGEPIGPIRRPLSLRAICERDNCQVVDACIGRFAVVADDDLDALAIGNGSERGSADGCGARRRPKRAPCGRVRGALNSRIGKTGGQPS